MANDLQITFDAAGGTRVADHVELGQAWVVLQDPEGNEFCVV